MFYNIRKKMSYTVGLMVGVILGIASIITSKITGENPEKILTRSIEEWTPLFLAVDRFFGIRHE